MTPGWTVAEDAGAHAEAAAGLIATIAMAVTAHRSATSFLKVCLLVSDGYGNPLPVKAGSNQCGGRNVKGIPTGMRRLAAERRIDFLRDAKTRLTLGLGASQPAISGVHLEGARNVPGHAWAADILSARRKRQPEV
jgi:hypothetical protein